MSRPVQNHLDSYKMYNQILQCLLILLINFIILYLNINLKNILKIFTPRPPPQQKLLQNHFQIILSDLSLRAPTPLCQNRVCLTRGVSPGAYRGAQGRSLKNTWKMFVFNCMIHFVTCIVTISQITELLGYP